jgi:hypothetical protein
MNRTNPRTFLPISTAVAALLIVGCGGAPLLYTPPGSIVVFATDVPLCNVESFTITITSASLVPPQGGQVPIVTSAAPAIVNFGRLAGLTSILNTTNVIAGTYNQLQISLTNPVLVVLNTATNPPTPVSVPVTLTTTSLTGITINPPLVVSANISTGITLDFKLRSSLQVDANGQVTGTVTPEFTINSSNNSGAALGEASALYGIAGAPSTTGVPSGFTGSFPLTLGDGTGQTVTILVNSSTVFEGDGVTSLSGLAASDFVEVDAIVNSSGQIVAQTVDAEEPTSFSQEQSALLGKVIAVARDGSGNATSLTLLVDDEVPPVLQEVLTENGNGGIIDGPFPVTLTTSTHYFTNWRQWNRQAFTFGPQALGLGQNVAIFGAYGSTAGSGFQANQIFLRPQSVEGNFKTLQAAGSDGVTGAFTMTPCGSLFGGQPITVLSYPATVLNGLSGLKALIPTPTLNTLGLLFFQQASGTANTGGSWTAPTWVMQARQIQQLPN